MSNQSIEQLVLTSSHIKLSDQCKKTNEWMVIHNHVVDVTEFKLQHPGGDEVLLEVCATDATAEYENIGHSSSAFDELLKYSVGQLEEGTSSAKQQEQQQQQQHQQKKNEASSSSSSSSSSSWWGSMKSWF